MTLGGFMCIRNGLDLDYCFQEAIRSMLPICDRIIVSDCQSKDGTFEELLAWSKKEPKLRIVRYEWTDPTGDTTWYPRWLNSARQYLPTDFACYLDADEVFHEKDYPAIREAVNQEKVLACYRYNFWADAQHLIPVGECCGVRVIRVGPANVDFPSDYPTPESAKISSMANVSDVGVYHYGFLRRREAFFRKAKAIQRIWANDYDPRLDAADKAGGEWMRNPVVSPWINNLDEFKGNDHPQIIKPWLQERGYVT